MKLSDVRLYDLIPEDLIFMLHHLKVDIEGLREYSPVNEEDTPSCFIYYNVLFRRYQFKDFSSGESGGPFKYIALKYDVSVEEAKTLVHNTLLNYLLGERKLPDILPKKASIEKVDKLLQEYQVIQDTPVKARRYRGINFNTARCEYTLCSYDDTAYKYFALYGLTKKDVEYYNIYTVCDVSIKARRSHESQTTTEEDISLDNIKGKYSQQKSIGYFNKAGHLLQIYLPKELNDHKEKKFFTLRPDITPHIKSIHKHSLIIAASIKDMICIHKCLRLSGLHKEIAVATLYSERKEATEQQIQVLSSLVSKKGTLYILYDNDDTGIKHSHSLHEQLSSLFPNVVNISMTDICASGRSLPYCVSGREVESVVYDNHGTYKIVKLVIKDFADMCRYMGLVQAQSWLYHHTIQPKHRHDIHKTP